MKCSGFTLTLLFLLIFIPIESVQAQDSEACDDSSSQGQTRKKRRRPGGVNRDCKHKQIEVNPETGKVALIEQKAIMVKPRKVMDRTYSAVPRPQIDDFKALIPIHDRWRIVDALGYQDRWYDPYNRNPLKGDKPIHGEDWFFNLDVISETTYESRETAVPYNSRTLQDITGLDNFRLSQHNHFNQNFALGLLYYQGNTTFKPPEHKFHFIPVLNFNHSEPKTNRTVNHIGIQALYYEKHLRTVSSNYDFDGLRIGIQPFTSDYRGFVFFDSPFGVRLFGTRKNYKHQYNLGLFRRLEKKQRSGLNDAGLHFRDDDILIANLYLQDKPNSGLTTQFTLIHNRNRETNLSNLAKSYDVSYLGYNGDGHWGRLNLTTSAYYAFGNESFQKSNRSDSDISAFFLASEFSIDFDWVRLNASFLYASGDDNPADNQANGFDAIDENPQFVGGDSSYWVRQTNTLLIDGDHSTLSSQNGLLNSLRSNGINSQSNFSNPGTALLGLGVDFDLLPQLSLSMNTNYLRFNETAPLDSINQAPLLNKNLGVDVSVAAVYRPLNSQNLIFRLSYSKLFAGNGFKHLFGNGNPDALLVNVILNY